MYKLLLSIVQDRLEILRRPKALVLGNEIGSDLRLEENQLSSKRSTFERIRHIERLIARAEIEIAVAFDAQGNILAIQYGQPSRVQFDWKQEKLIMPDGIVTHNHPNQSYFSADDLFYVHRLNAAELRAVAGNIVHRLVRPATGWDSNKLNQFWKSETKKLEHRVGLGKVTKEQIKDIVRNLPRRAVDELSLFTQPDNI